jgi:hypothetical protein
MRWRWAALAAGAALAGGLVLVVAGAPAQRPEWREVSPPPLSPRELPTGFWTGEEVILVGGSDAPPCPPWAECAIPAVPPLSDGAAYDIETDTWRTIANAPVRFSWAQAVVVGPTAYLWIPGEPQRPQAPSAFLAYGIDEDRWEELAMPTAEPGWYGLVDAGGRLVAVRSSDEAAERPDLVYDPAASAWSELPDDPFTPGFDRIAVWDGEELLLFDHEIEAVDDDHVPLRGAAFAFESGTWRELDDPDETWAREGPTAAPSPDPPEAAGEAAVTTEVIAGADRLLFLGSNWPEGDEDGELHALAWLVSSDP